MITHVAELLAEVQRLGITLVVEGNRLRYAPADRLPAEIVGRLKERKAEVIAALGANALATPTNAPTARNESEVVELLPESDAMPEPDSIELGADGWPIGTIDPFLIEPCGKCGSLELWENVIGNSRCMRCDPPLASRRLVEACRRLRFAGRREPNRQVKHADAWKPSLNAPPKRGAQTPAGLIEVGPPTPCPSPQTENGSHVSDCARATK